MERFKEIDQLKRKLDSYRPIPAEKILAVQQKFRIDWTYHSRSIEGATLTLSETAFFILEGLTSKGKPLSEYLETQNHWEAISYLEDLVKGDTELSERVTKDLHGILFNGIDHIFIGSTRKKLEPGKYKYDNNHVILADGSIHHFTDHLQVPGEMERLIKWYKENESKLHPVETAAIFHHRITAIHPFTDGNGRVARLAMNLILMKKGFTPAIIKNEEREDYYAALRAADGGDDAPFISLVEKEVTNTMVTMINVIEGKDAYSLDDLKRRLSHFSKNVESLDKDIGKYSKDLEEERINTLEQLPKKIKKLVDDLSTGSLSDKFDVRSINICKIQDRPESGPIYNIVTQKTSFHVLFDVKGYRGFLDQEPRLTIFQDEITREGTCVGLFLKGKRRYIPSGALLFFAMPTRFTVVLSSYVIWGDLTGDVQSYDVVPDSFRYLVGSTCLMDWSQREIDDFFTQNVRNFMDSVDREIEKRRQEIEQELKTTKRSRP